MAPRPFLTTPVGQYALITTNYWTFTLTDGALRMLVLLYFYQLGYSPFELAALFIFYEIFGVITNAVGGWLGARIGLNKTMNLGIAIQLLALSMLLVSQDHLTVTWVMCAQALSGIAKDLNKMSAKSSIKLLVPETAKNKLFKWVSLLTGSKNTLKGAGFFLGGALLSSFGFTSTIFVLAVGLTVVWVCSLFFLENNDQNLSIKKKFSSLFSNAPSINRLSAARLFLFASRDVWFVIALPVYLASEFGWSHSAIGAYLAFWIIGYGLIQAVTPKLFKRKTNSEIGAIQAAKWAALLAVIPAVLAYGLTMESNSTITMLVGLAIFGIVFAVNSSLHSFLIVDFASKGNVSMDVGFYYMSNAMGRLLGTLLSGWLFQNYGIISCLIVSSFCILTASVISLSIRKESPNKYNN